MERILVFLAGSLVLAYFSRRRLFTPSHHGFWRYFAFESILALIAINLNMWFFDPFSPMQIISWVFLIASLGLAVHGFLLLRYIGRPKEGFEDTTQIVRVGAYRRIRHPLYTSLLFLAWGAFFKLPSIAGAALAIGASAFLYLTGRVEEVENLSHFGQGYADYQKETRMFIPWVF